MNNKEELLLNEIVMYMKENGIMPTRRYLQKKLGYKSVNSITQYFKSLVKQNYLKYSNNKLIINQNYLSNNYSLKLIRVINAKNKYLSIILDKGKKYCAYIIKNNYFKNEGIIKGDLLVVELGKKIKPHDIGLFIIDNKYRIMRYDYKAGFFILNDNEEIILNRINTIGKVIMVERKIEKP